MTKENKLKMMWNRLKMLVRMLLYYPMVRMVDRRLRMTLALQFPDFDWFVETERKRENERTVELGWETVRSYTTWREGDVNWCELHTIYGDLLYNADAMNELLGDDGECPGFEVEFLGKDGYCETHKFDGNGNEIEHYVKQIKREVNHDTNNN